MAINGKPIATGVLYSYLWFVSPDYVFRGSYAALQQYRREVREENQLNAQIAADVMARRRRQR